MIVVDILIMTKSALHQKKLESFYAVFTMKRKIEIRSIQNLKNGERKNERYVWE